MEVQQIKQSGEVENRVEDVVLKTLKMWTLKTDNVARMELRGAGSNAKHPAPASKVLPPPGSTPSRVLGSPGLTPFTHRLPGF